MTTSPQADVAMSCQTVARAIGIVMERFQLNEERAFHYLVRVSQTSNVKLRHVALELVQEVNEDAEPVDPCGVRAAYDGQPAQK